MENKPEIPIPSYGLNFCSCTDRDLHYHRLTVEFPFLLFCCLFFVLTVAADTPDAARYRSILTVSFKSKLLHSTEPPFSFVKQR